MNSLLKYTYLIKGKGLHVAMLLVGMLFYQCQDETIIEIPAYKEKLVVDGWVEQDSFPKVMLTNSAAYFSTVDSVSIRELVVRIAKVSVSDGENTEVLTLMRNDGYFPPFIYQGTDIRGEVGKTYELTVELGGQAYRSSTYIPKPPTLDSVWYKPEPKEDSAYSLLIQFTDRGGEDNFYRAFTRTIGKNSRFVPTYLSSVSDQGFNGQETTMSLVKGSESLSDILDDVYYYKGDTIDIKFCTIDKAHFEFWRTAEKEMYFSSNPLSPTGNKVYSNIEGENVLGVWGGYGASYARIIIP